ncbi:titin isoform X7 [Vigna unguiculata]|uniref:titin isoform X7 n=1 Tax=Vigna unguiculata TaxID=3917 RepID=UPI001015F9DB|nr:titin isoform X7 [Vigna unguiculata]
MEAETDSPEDASPVCVPLVKSFKNIGSEEITFPQKHGNDVNSKYPLVEEKGNADSSKTDEVSEIRPQEIHQESCKVFVGSEKQTEVPAGWSKQRDSEGMVMTESIPKSSIEEQGKVPGEHEHEHMSTIPELAINPTEVAVKICEEETYKEEEGLTATDNDQSCRPENELDETSKALEAIDQTQFTGKDTAEYEHADHQSEAPSTENVIAKHSNSEQLPTKSSIKSNCDEEPLEKTLELYSVDNSEIKKDGKVMSEKAIGVPADGTLKTLSTTACVGAAELENKDEGKFTLEKEKEMEAATDMQLLKSATDSPPDNKDLPAVSTSEFVKGHTDEIPQQQTHKNDETSVTDTGKSSAESDDDEKLDKEEKAIEEAIKTQLVNTETESLPEEEVQLRLPTPDIVQQNTDQIIKEQPLNQDQPDMIDNAQSCIAEKEPDRVIEEPVEIETKHNIRILKEQEDQQSEEKSMQNVTANSIIEGHVTPKSSTKVADDVHKSDSIKNLEKKDANEIREVEATDVKQSTNVEKQKAEAKGMSEDKGLQTLPSAELVGNKAIEESCKGHIKPEAGLAVTYANEEQALQHEFDKKEEILEEEACQLTAESEAKPEPQIVAQNNETTCIKHPYLDREASEMNPIVDTIEHEISMPHAKFNQEEEKGTEKETKMQLEDTTESVPKEETIQPIAIAELVRIKAHDESSPEANVTVKSNKEVQTSNVIENEEIWDTGKCNQVEEEQTTEEPTKSQLQEEQVQTRSPTPASVHGDPNQIWQQETLYINESEINDNDKQGSIPKIAQDPKLTIAQETDKPETEDNVGIVTEKLENKHASEIRSKEGTDAKQLTDVEIPKSEIEGVSIDEAQQPIANTVFVGTEVVDEGSGEEIESEADAKLLSNNEEQRPEYVTEGTVGINDTNYTYEKEGVPTSPVSVKEGIENDRKFSKEEESKRVEEKTKMQLQEEQVQTRSPTPISVQGDSNQIHQQETLCIDESEVFDNAKQWCIAAIELEKDTTVVQETRNSETNDKIITVAENLHHKDETEIKEEEGTYAQKSTEVEMLQSEREGMPVDEAQQTMANAVSVRSEALDESSQEEILPEAYVTEKSNKEVKTPESVTNEVVETNTTNYTEKQEVPKGYVRERGRIGDKFNQEKEVEGIEATNTQLLEEEVQIRSSTYVSVQSDINQIPQQQTVNVNESEVIEIAIVVQESEVSEAKDNASRVIENLDKDESEIRAEDGTDAKELTDLDMSKSETEEKIQDDGKFNQREKEKRIDEVTEILTPEEEVHTTSPTPAFVKSHTDITEQQIAFHLNESNVIATAKQSCIPEFEHDRNPTVVQEIEVFETKHNIDRVMENSDKEKTKIRENEKTDATQLNEESGQQDKQLEADITDKSNKKVKTPEYVTEENLETNITDYAEEKNKSPTDHAKEKEGIEAIFNQEEKEKLIEETTKTHSEEEEVQTHAPAFVLGDTNQIPHQETMHANESKVMDNAKQSYIPEIELDEKAIVLQETEVSESLYKKDPTEIRVKKEIDAKKLTDSEMPKPETEEDEEALQPIADVVLVRTEVVEESGKQETQPKEDVTDKSNREVLIKKFVTEEGAEINTNNCTKEHDTVQASPANELEGTDDVKLHEEEADEIEEKTKTQIPEEEFQTSSPTPAFVQDDSGQTLQQETVNIDESEVLDNDKHSCIPEIELDGKSTVVEETNNPAIEDNISTGAKDLDNKDAIEVRAEEGTYVKQLTNVEIPNSEIKAVPKDEALELIENIVLIGTEPIDEGSQQVIQPQADVKTPEYVTAETREINTTNYSKEQEKVPSIHAEDEGIKNKFNHKEEAKGIEEATKIQSLEEVQTKSPTPIFVQGDKNQVPYQETLPVDGSKVIDNAKQSCIPEIELHKNSLVAQESEKPETKNNVNIITKNFDDKDASEIRAEEVSYDKQVTEVERSKSLTEEYEVPQPIAITVAVGTEIVDDSNQEKIQHEEDVSEKKSSNEEQSPHYIDEDTAQINTNSYPDEHDKDLTPHAKGKEGIENEENLDQTEKAKGIDKTSKMKIPEEEIQIRSTPPAIVQDDIDQISQQEILHVDESKVIEHIKQNWTPEMEFDRKSTIIQETEKPETKDNVGIITENKGTNNARNIRAEEATDSKKLADFKMHNPEIEETDMSDNEVPQPVAITATTKTKTVDDSNYGQIQLEDLIEKESNKEEQTLQYVAEDTVKINTNNYTNEHDKVQDEEAKDIEETTKMQLDEQKVQKTSPTPTFVQGDTDQISQQELLHIVESEVHYDKHSSIPEIEPDRKSTIVQETEKTETISKETENLGTNDASEISAKEETDVKILADLKMPKSEIQEDEVPQPTTIAVVDITKTVDGIKQEQRKLEEDIANKKSKEEQTPLYVAEDIAEINTNSYTEEHDKVQTSATKVKEWIEDDKSFGQQEEVKAIAETNKIQLPREDVQRRSHTLDFVQRDTDHISHQELPHVEDSEVIDYVKHSCIQEIELDRKSTIAQETEEPKHKDNISTVTENLSTNDGSEVKGQEQTGVKTLADIKMPKSKIEEEVHQPIAIAEVVITETVDDITVKKSNEEEKVQTLAPTPAFVHSDMEQISQEELLHVDESKVIEYVKQSCIRETELQRKSTIPQETEKPETKDNISKVTENLGTNDAREIKEEEETNSKKMADFKMQDSEIEGGEVRQSIATAVAVITQTVDDSKLEQIQLDKDITEKKSNKEEQTPQFVAEDTAEINTTNYNDENQKVQTSNVEVKEEIEEDENFGQQQEVKAIGDNKMQLPKENVQTISPTPAYVQCNTDQILNKELLHVDESEIIDYVKQSRIPEIELDTTIAQETEKPETKDNISNVTENLGTDHGSEIRAEEDTYVKNLADLKIPESEIKETEVPEDEVPQPIAVAVEVETERVADINQKEIQPKEDITEKKSNKDEQSSHYVAKDTTELKANSYTDEHDKVQTSHAEVNQGTEGDEKCSQEENAKGIEEMNKMQLHEEEVQIRSSTPPFVQDDTDQISQQELLLVDESKVIDYVEQSCKPEIELDRKSTIVQQEIEKPETKDNVSILTENLGTNDASEIKAKEEIDAEKLADVNMIQSEIEGVPKDETPKPIANAVLLRTEAVEKSSQQDKQLVAEVADKSIKEVQNQEFIIEGNVEININSEAEEKDKNSTFNAEKKEGTSHANGKEGIEDIFNQKEKEKEIEEATKTHSVEEEEIQRRSPPPAFVQGDTDQIQHQETLHINESEVIDNAKLSHIPEIELHEKAIVVQKSEKLETKDNFDRVRENLNKAESENRAEEGIDVKQLTDLEMPKSETEAGVPEDESLQQMSDTVSVEKEAVSVSQEKRQPQEEFIKKVDEEVETPQYFIEDREKLETANDTEEQEEVPTSQPKEKSGNKDDNKFEEEQEEKGIEESTKTQLQDEDIRTTLPIQTSVQGDFDQILQKQTVHDNESKGIGNAERSCTQEIELNGKSTIVEEPETKDNVNIVKQEHADNQSEKSSIQGVTTTYNITEEGLVKSESNREISEVHIDEQDAVKSCSRENLHNKNACEIRVEKASEAKQSTYVEIQESETQDEPEDKALKRKLNSSSNGNEALDESSLEEFTENFNNDAQTPQRNTKVNAETNITTYPDKQQEFPACHANEKQGIQDKGKFEEEEAEEIEESIEKQLPEEEIQHTLPTPTSVQDNIDQMSQLQTLHDDEIEVIDNAKSCMPEIELDRKSIVVKESKQQETKANVDLVKEEQADNQSEESSVQSFITNYIIVERHTTSESNKELSDDVNPDGQKKVESHLVEFLEIKDASEIRAKGIHSKQLTDVEIQKSETEGMAEDRGMQTMSSTTSVKNDAFNECCQEEIQPREEYAETHIKEVNMPHYEFYMQKHIPEAYGVQEDTCQIRVENEQKFKSQLASLIKETTFIDNLYSDGEIEKTNPSNDVEKDVNPQSHNKEKLEIHDDSKFNEEEANGIEEMTKIKLLNSATDSPPEEVQPKLPDPATVQGDTGQILQQQTLAADASDTIDNNMRKIPENELDRMSTSVEEPETKANINIEEEEEEEQSDKQSHEPSMQSLITDYITVEGHLASENSSNMNEQKTVNLQLVENLGIKYASKPTTEEVTDAKQPTGVEVEKTKNEEMIENETLDESNQEEMQAEEDFSGTHTKGKQTPQSSMENVNSEGMEITESSTKSSYAEEEQEQVINPYTIENSEIKDGTKIKLEEASDIKEATDEPVTKAISVLSTIPSVRIWIVDESIQEKIQKDVQTSVINTKEEQRPENDFVRNMEVQEACDLKKGPGNTSVENDEKVEVQSEANNQKTIKKNPNLEELETAEISPSSDTKELGKEHEVAKLGGVSESVSIDITKQIDTGKLETQEAETGLSDNTKEDKAGEEFEKISPSSSVGVISKDSQDTSTKVLHKKSHGILSGVGSKVKHSISKVKKVITGKSSRPKTPPS